MTGGPVTDPLFLSVALIIWMVVILDWLESRRSRAASARQRRREQPRPSRVINLSEPRPARYHPPQGRAKKADSMKTKISCALGLVIVLLTTTASGQSRGQSPNEWFRVSWAPQVNGATRTPRIEASVHNDSPYRVTNVRLRVEGLDADNHPVGQRSAWAFGDIAPGGETAFVVESVPGAVTYRMTVISFDLVSSVQAP